jgi:hypothetical protein
VSWTRRWSLDIDDLQHVDPAILIKPDCFGHSLLLLLISRLTITLHL